MHNYIINNVHCCEYTIDRKVYYDLTAETSEDLRAAIDDLFAAFHPYGYGTSVTNSHELIARVTRYQSCD
jgi:hypothetical protein